MIIKLRTKINCSTLVPIPTNFTPWINCFKVHSFSHPALGRYKVRIDNIRRVIYFLIIYMQCNGVFYFIFPPPNYELYMNKNKWLIHEELSSWVEILRLACSLCVTKNDFPSARWCWRYFLLPARVFFRVFVCINLTDKGCAWGVWRNRMKSRPSRFIKLLFTIHYYTDKIFFNLSFLFCF